MAEVTTASGEGRKGKPAPKRSLAVALASIGGMWDATQYSKEFSIDTFIQKVGGTAQGGRVGKAAVTALPGAAGGGVNRAGSTVWQGNLQALQGCSHSYCGCRCCKHHVWQRRRRRCKIINWVLNSGFVNKSGLRQQKQTELAAFRTCSSRLTSPISLGMA